MFAWGHFCTIKAEMCIRRCWRGVVVKEDAIDCTSVGMLLPEIHLWIRIMFQMHSHLNICNQVTLHIFATTSNRLQS